MMWRGVAGCRAGRTQSDDDNTRSRTTVTYIAAVSQTAAGGAVRLFYHSDLLGFRPMPALCVYRAPARARGLRFAFRSSFDSPVNEDAALSLWREPERGVAGSYSAYGST